MKRPRVRLVIAGVLATFMVAGAAITALLILSTSESEASYRGSLPPEGFALPEFALSDYTGRRVSSQQLDGKVVLITFLDSQCDEACPIIAFQIARTLDSLTPDEQAQVVAIAISTDPDEDTAEAVESFLEKNRAVGKLRYLVAPISQLRPVWEEFMIAASVDTGVDTLHSAPVRIYDRQRVWVSTLHAGADLTTENLAHDLRVALAGTPASGALR